MISTYHTPKHQHKYTTTIKLAFTGPIAIPLKDYVIFKSRKTQLEKTFKTNQLKFHMLMEKSTLPTSSQKKTKTPPISQNYEIYYYIIFLYVVIPLFSSSYLRGVSVHHMHAYLLQIITYYNTQLPLTGCFLTYLY